MNRVILCGRLTKQPEIRYSQTVNGSMAVARYTLAVDRAFKKEGEQAADFINCIAFGEIANAICRKGEKDTAYHIEGNIRTNSYEKNGKKNYSTNVVVESFRLLDA